MALCLSLCLCVCHKSDFCRNGWKIRPAFWHESFLPPVLHCAIRKFWYLQNKGTSVWNFVPNSGLRKFYHGKSTVLSTGRRSSFSATPTTVDEHSSIVILWFLLRYLGYVPQTRSSYQLTTAALTAEKLFSERVVKVWNSLPPSIVNFSSSATFRNSLNKISLRIHTK